MRVVATAVSLVALIIAPAASANSTRIDTDPHASTTTATSPHRVSATCNETVQLSGAPRNVVGPDGAASSIGRPQVCDAEVGVDLSLLRRSGRYTATYDVGSEGGRSTAGSWSFEFVGGDPLPQLATAQPDESASDAPLRPVAAFATATALGIFWALRAPSLERLPLKFGPTRPADCRVGGK
jgi:methionine-rich copper-binding protein CopC